jgi:hypothetical protein
MHSLRQPALDPPGEVRVETELEDGATPGVLGQLRVYGLVRPITELARFLDPKQHVGTAAPPTVTERSLHDGAGAVSHCENGAFEGCCTLHLAKLSDINAAFSQVLDICLFVRETPFLQQRESGISPLGCFEVPLSDRAVEFRQMPAGEVVREVAGGEL